MSIKIEGYEILEQAGGTTDTTIWTARQISLDRNVSIWVMKDRSAADANLVNHFSTITRAISRLKHNNFPPVIDISTTQDGLPYIVFENAYSVSVARVIKENGPYNAGKALEIAKEVALALDAAWKQVGFVHRNLKPENIRISADGNIKIFNFNSATIVQPGVNPLAFDDGMVVGTPNYASPEQIDCLPTIDFHADMYGLGATLYQMLTGTSPFDEERDPMKILELQRSGHLPNPKLKNPALSDDVVYILARLMAKSPNDRYAWWLDVVEDIEHTLAGRPLRKEPPNGAVRSTIDLLSVGVAPLTMAPLTPQNQSPIITPIIPGVPVNNAPIASGAYAETVRNVQPSENQNPVQVEEQKNQFAKQDVKKTKTSTSIPKQPVAARKSNYKSYVNMRPSGVVVLLTRLVCVLLFVGGIYTIVQKLGPAGSVEISQPVMDEEAPVVPLSKSSKIANDNSADDEVASSTVEDMNLSELSDFEEDEFVENVASSGDTVASSVSSTSEVVTQTQKTETTSTTVEEVSPRDEMLRKVYEVLSTKPLTEARAEVKKIFDEYASKPGVNRAECRGILMTLNAAVLEVEAVGFALIRQTQIAFKKVTIAGKTFEVKAQGYANGELICIARKVGSTETRNITIPLAKASAEEMYNILRTEPDSSKELQITKAILAMRAKNRSNFIRHANGIKALKPFAELVK